MDWHAWRSMNAANRVTVARILGIPVFVLLMLYYKDGLIRGEANPYLRVAALVLFVTLAATDALDGYLARSRGQVTFLGKALDPLADKALMVSALVMLTRPGLPLLQPQFPLWFALLVISREAILFLGALLIHGLSGKVILQPRLAGKAATACFMLAIVLALSGSPSVLFDWLVRITGLLVAVAGVQYLLDGFRQLEMPESPSP